MAIGAGITVQAEDWPQFRGPTSDGLSTAKNTPVEWNTERNVRWKVVIPGSGWSSPVTSNGKIYLTTAAPTEGRSAISLRVLCLNADGKVEWNVAVVEPEEGLTKAKHQKNSQASPTPTLAGDRLYVHFGHLGTAALDLSGKVLWKQTGIQYPPVHGNGGSPAIIGDLVVFNCDGERDPFMAALDAKTGKLRWKTPRDIIVKKYFSFSTPLEIEIGGSKQIISASSGFVGGFDPANGKELWRVRYGEGYSVVPRPVFAGGWLYIGTGFDRPSILAIDPKGAHGDVTETNIKWTLAKGAPNTPSLLVAGDEVYAVSDGGIASCVDAKTGSVHWNERLKGNFSASPIYADGKVYFQNETGVGFVVKAGRKFELLAENDLKEKTLASYAVMGDTLLIRSESHLWRIGAAK